MAVQSPDARHKSRLIREMARDLNTTSHSCASSTGSHHGTVSEDSFLTEFDPENEAHMSTRQFELDLSQRLPQLRDTAKKFARWNGGLREPFVVNTSAVGRAFPDFSQGGSDDSTSIEIGRGIKSKNRLAGSVAYHEYSGNINSPVMDLGEFSVRRTPPSKNAGRKVAAFSEDVRTTSKKDSRNTRTRPRPVAKENVPPPHVSKPSKSVGDHDMLDNGSPAIVAEHKTVPEYQQFTNDLATSSRPSSMISQVKTSRFTANLAGTASPGRREVSERQERSLDPISPKHGQSEHQSLVMDPHQEKSRTDIGDTHGGDATQQSFLIPNIPDISELVSGTFKNGTPVFPRAARLKSHPPLQNTPAYSTQLKADGRVNVLPLPDEERNLYLSLELLQQRVAILEMEKAKHKKDLEVLQRQNYELVAEASELRKLRSIDSALGDSGSDAEHAQGYGQSHIESKKLQGQIISLQDRLDAHSRTIAAQDLRLKDNTVERDAAVIQLAQAWRTSEQLNTENDELRQANSQLQRQINQLTAHAEAAAYSWQGKEAELQEKVRRQQRALKQMHEVTREMSIHTKRVEDAAEHLDPSRNNDTGAGILRHWSNTTRAVAPDASMRAEHSRAEYLTTPTSHIRGVEAQSQTEDRHSRHAAVDSQITSDCQNAPGSADANLRAQGVAGKSRSTDDFLYAFQADSTPHSNFSSILGHGEMVAMRDALEGMKSQKFGGKDICSQDNGQLDIDPVDFPKSAESAVKPDTSTGNRGSLHSRSTSEDRLHGHPKVHLSIDHKGPKSRPSMKLHGTCNSKDQSQLQETEPHQRRRSESDGMKIAIDDASEPCASGTEDSAFMPSLPESMSCAKKVAAEHHVLSDSARNVLGRLVDHDCENCTVCSRITSFRQQQSGAIHTSTNTSTIRIQRPIPVSDRAAVATPHNDEPTLRPLTKPSLALATVIKIVQDELAHMKMRLQRHQDTYNAHDASLGKRQRKLLKYKIEHVLEMIDDKADQLYALYDVLEGQKQSGELLEEDSIKETLQKNSAARGVTETENNDEIDDAEHSEPDLPWEGIDSHESTTTKGYKNSTFDEA